jgi:hypothetical protein
MVAVALLGVVVGIERLYQRRAACLARAAFHAKLEDRARSLADSMLASDAFNAREGNVSSSQFWRKRALLQRAESDRQASLRRKYERAARYPWLPIEDDPRKSR